MSYSKIAANAGLMETQASEVASAKLRRVVIAATIGNVLEWYDFLVYGLLAMTIAVWDAKRQRP